MPPTIAQLADFAAFLAHREARERDDASALAELARRPLPLAAGLVVEWLGVAGYRISFEGHTLLIDPYVSRVPLSSVLRRTRVRADTALHDRLFAGGDDYGEVDGILVGHTHFDHAIDVPELTRRFDTRAYGSASLAALMELHGLRERTQIVETKITYELGPFVVEFHPSLHSKLLLGLAVPFDGEVTCEHLDALTPAAYRCGQIYGIRISVAGTTLYHQGSANLIDEQVPSGGVDVFLAGIAGRSFTRDYWPRILSRLRPQVVVASHFDDFFRPLEAPMGYSTNVNLAAFPDEVAAVSREIGVAALPPALQPPEASPAKRSASASAAEPAPLSSATRSRTGASTTFPTERTP